MLNISYDNKPLHPNIQRVRLHVIDSFINDEKMLIDEILIKKRSILKPEKIKRLHDLYNELDKVLEKKRIFQIKLKGILSWRRPEAKEFIKQLNEDNKPYSEKRLTKENEILKKKIKELEQQIEIYRFDKSCSSTTSSDE